MSGAPPLRSGSEPIMAGLGRGQERGAAGGDEEGLGKVSGGPSGTQGSGIFESVDVFSHLARIVAQNYFAPKYEIHYNILFVI